MIGRCGLLALGFAFSLVLAPPAAATVHALVMGFDHYQSKIALEGSRNDALDIASVLRKRGVADITAFDERSGKRLDVMRAWNAMNARAVPGDILFVAFSGHGNKSPEKGEPKHRPDGMDKGFLLPLYDEDKFPEEQLRDEDLYDLFKISSDKGLKIIFVADACHSGGAVRGIGAPPRFQRFETHGKPLPPPPATVVRRSPIANLTIYSAADENQTIAEFTINEQRRGALSYAVARGLEGGAGAPDGSLTEGDLGRYVITNARLWSNNTQIPTAVTPAPDVRIFSNGSVATSGMPDLSPLAFFTEADAAVDRNTIRRVGSKRLAELSWTAQGVVSNGHGDMIARGISPNRIQDAIDTRRVLNALTVLAGQPGRTLAARVSPVGKPAVDRNYGAGEQIKIEADRSDLGFLTVVDLTADGTVQFLWPHKTDPLEWTATEKPNFIVNVTPPFGADTLIFIETDKPLTDLHGQLAGLDGKAAPIAFYDVMRLWLPRVKARLALQPVFTCAAVQGDGSCQ